MLKGKNLVVGQSVRFGDNRDQVDLVVEFAHEFDVDWPESVFRVGCFQLDPKSEQGVFRLRVSRRLYEVDTGMYPVVH